MRLCGVATFLVVMILVSTGWSCGHNNSEANAECEVPSMPGVRICCGRPDDVPGDTCVPRPSSDAERSCTSEGKLFDGRMAFLGEGCCPGLVEVDPYVLADAGQPSGEGLPEGCAFDPGPPGRKLCIQCGDRVCGPAENYCTCPKDCPH